MKEQKIYLNPDISLSDLSAATAIPIHTLSRLINENFKVNFNDFINGYRVEFVKRKIQLGEAQNKTLLSLAFESGFNSKATFNRAFKKHTGSTPKDFFTSKQE